MARDRLTKSEFVNTIADRSGLSKEQVATVLSALNAVVVEQLSNQGPGEVTIPGLIKLNLAIKPATPARDGIHPFTKQPTVFKAKPARRVVKARPIKALKDAV